MSILQSIKPFWPLLFTFILPRLINFLRAANITYRTRPQPTPLAPPTRTALNVLFVSVVFFFASSIKPAPPSTDNVFVTALARLSLPTDALFARLEMARKGEGGVSVIDEALRTKLTTRVGRELYLRFGTETLVNCDFCVVGDELSYLLFHIPGIAWLHLLHFALLGVGMSESIGGFEVGRWRRWALLGALWLVILDGYMLVGFEQNIDVNGPAPMGLFWVMRVMRPLMLCLYDVVVAGVVWASTTNRLLVFGAPAMDGEGIKRKNLEQINSSLMNLQTTQTKLRAANVVRNAVVRDRTLKQVEDGYWREVGEVESREGLSGGSGMEGVWEDEAVQTAMARAYGQGAIDVRRMRREAEGFVRAVTGHLDGTGLG